MKQNRNDCLLALNPTKNLLSVHGNVTIKSSKPNYLHDLLLKLVNAIPEKYIAKLNISSKLHATHTMLYDVDAS